MKKLLILTMVLCVVGFTTGCIDKIPPKTPANAEKFTELNIPANFNWSTTTDVTCNITAESRAKVFVSETADGKPFATFYVGGDAEPVSLNIPAATNTLYVRHKTKTGMSSAYPVPVTNNAISYQLPGFGFDDSPEERTDDCIYIPARNNGWGTLMFEDLWPNYGDYDFNDFVLNYKIQLYLTSNNRVEAMMVAIRMKAVGGSLPYDLYLQMHGVKVTDIETVEEAYPSKNMTKEAAMVLIEPKDLTKNRAFFRFDNIKGNKNKPQGAKYLNTERGYELSDKDQVEVSYVVYFKQPIAIKKVEFAGLDFFIAQKDTEENIEREIHRVGYEPVNRGYYNSMAIDPNLEWYRSKDNLVWAFNVPADINHTYEKIDFMNAYPQFKIWAQSGGEQSKDWYQHGDQANLVSGK